MTDDGGPAFATGNPTDGGFSGMSLRDYFAAAALTGIFMTLTVEESAQAMSEMSIRDKLTVDEAIASKAWDIADAMIAERNK